MSVEIQLDGLEHLRQTDGWNDVIVGIVQINSANLVGPGEEEDAFVADAALPVFGQLHHVRAVAAISAVEAQQTQVRAVAVVSAARVD